MRMQKIILLILLIIVFSSGISHSQRIKKFSDTEVEFLEELNSFLTYGSKKEGKVLFETFAEHWMAGYFTASEKTHIMENSNLLLKKRAKAFPNFENYLNSLMAFNNSLQDVLCLILTYLVCYLDF